MQAGVAQSGVCAFLQVKNILTKGLIALDNERFVFTSPGLNVQSYQQSLTYGTLTSKHFASRIPVQSLLTNQNKLLSHVSSFTIWLFEKVLCQMRTVV